MKTHTITCEWDPEAQVWYVAESDVPGLVCEAETLELLTEKLQQRIPEMLSLNEPGAGGRGASIPWQLIARRQERTSSAR